MSRPKVPRAKETARVTKRRRVIRLKDAPAKSVRPTLETAKRPVISILLVDDYEDGLDMYREYLTYRGYRVVLARNGEEAIAQARAHRPDAILLDIRMAGMTGTDAMRVLRADSTFQHTPIVALTAHALDAERKETLAAGFDDLISKPCLPEQLVHAVERILSSARGPQVPAREVDGAGTRRSDDSMTKTTSQR
jgi:CheY-like chemotaxis protein